MISRSFNRAPLALGLAFALLCTGTTAALAAPQEGQSRRSGELTVSGEVNVDGAKAISGATVFSDSTISTSEKSSAIVTVSNLGRVELLPNSSMKLSFNQTGVTGTLDSGRARVSTQQGAMASVATKDATVVASNESASAFNVDVECGNTAVAATAGKVELRAGDSVKQIAAGSQDTAGTAVPGTRCTRLETSGAGAGVGGIGGGALAALLIASAAAVGAAIYAVTSDSNEIQTSPGGSVVVVSPSGF